MADTQEQKRGGWKAGLLILTAALVVVVVLSLAGVGPIPAAAVAVVGMVAAWFVAILTVDKGAVAAGGSVPQTAGEKPAPETAAPGNGCAAVGEAERRNALIEGELSAAREIQMRLVPSTFPPVPNCPEFDLYAAIDPAKEIGGDFYDFWLLGKQRLAVVMADVSGKGIPAALYMAMARTYMRAFSRSIHDPGKLLERLNREVSRHNPGSMFVTVFCGIIDLVTGKVEYANAGHNPPFRKKPGKPVEVMDMAENPPVGFLPGIEYSVGEFTLEPDEVLFLYTDGFPESTNLEEVQMGEETAISIFGEAADTSCMCSSIIMQVRSHIMDYAKNTPQYDDVTLLCYRHVGDKDWTGSGRDAGGDDEPDEETLLGTDSIMSSLSDSRLQFNPNADIPMGDRFTSLSDLKGGED